MEDPDPDRIWTSAVLRGYFPGEPTVKFNKILKRLCDEGTVVRLSGAPGRYRRAVGAPGSAPALVEIRTGDPAWDVDATLSPSPEDPSVDFRSVAHLERQIVEVLRSPSGRRWRPDQLASALGVPVSAVEAVLPTLLADKEIEKPVDGAYIATDPAIAEEGWPRVS
ncbi:hypothetical protein C8E97_0365 [Saccharothrix australiensis]|uniref:Uncharacterized protein n=2 Tax=Saccharothrix australiensis TaxID=2072 RepID=A0A495VTY2_9PSEU|nr:hypothetical protein C8E97_0365 [Saccharothrix australiensis]